MAGRLSLGCGPCRGSWRLLWRPCCASPRSFRWLGGPIPGCTRLDRLRKSFVTSSRGSRGDLARRLNGVGPDDIAVTAATVVDDDFDARRSAKSRSYRYRLLARSAPSPFEQEPRPLVAPPHRPGSPRKPAPQPFRATTTSPPSPPPRPTTSASTATSSPPPGASTETSSPSASPPTPSCATWSASSSARCWRRPTAAAPKPKALRELLAGAPRSRGRRNRPTPRPLPGESQLLRTSFW